MQNSRINYKVFAKDQYKKDTNQNMGRQQPEKTLFWRNEMSLNGVVVVSLPLLLCLILLGGSGLIIRTSGRLDPTIEDRTNLNIKLMRIVVTEYFKVKKEKKIKENSKTKHFRCNKSAYRIYEPIGQNQHKPEAFISSKP